MTKKLTKSQQKEIRINKLKSQLRELIDQTSTTIHTDLLHVSRSGMMRSIKVYLSDMTDITDIVAEISNYSFHKTGGLKVTGGGMDMGFSVVYDLSCSLYCQDDYTHDGAYKLNQRWL